MRPSRAEIAHTHHARLERSLSERGALLMLRQVPDAERLERLPVLPGEDAATARANLLRNLELIREQAAGDD